MGVEIKRVLRVLGWGLEELRDNGCHYEWICGYRWWWWWLWWRWVARWWLTAARSGGGSLVVVLEVVMVVVEGHRITEKGDEGERFRRKLRAEFFGLVGRCFET